MTPSHDNATDIVEQAKAEWDALAAPDVAVWASANVPDLIEVLSALIERDATLRKQLENAREQIVTLWHDSNAGNGSLHECLGMTLEEYAAWVNPDALKGQPC